MQLDLWQAVVLGLVEGVTEYLPVSSTGHMILASAVMGLDRTVDKQSLDDFEIVIQGGAILAVVTLYWPALLKMIRGLLGRDGKGFSLFVNLVIAFLPSGLLGLLLQKKIHAWLFHPVPVLAAIVLGGLYMIVVDAFFSGRIARTRSTLSSKSIYDVTPREALFIGLLQCFALWPGTSRSLMTITGGLFVGLKPRAAAEFSFLLGLPTLLAATGYKLAKSLYEAKRTGSPNLFQELGTGACVVGMLVAAVSAAVAVRWLVHFLNKRGLAIFGVYRIALGVVMMGLLGAGVVRFAPPTRTDATQKEVPPVHWTAPAAPLPGSGPQPPTPKP